MLRVLGIHDQALLVQVTGNSVEWRDKPALPPTTQQTERLHLSLPQNTRADRIAGMADHHVVNVEVSFAGISTAPFGRASLDCHLPVRRGQFVVKHWVLYVVGMVDRVFGNFWSNIP